MRKADLFGYFAFLFSFSEKGAMVETI